MENKKRIIIIDDEIEFLNEVEEVLRTCNYKVYCLFDNKNATQMAKEIKEFNPDLILLDIFLKNKTGFDIVESIKMYPELKSIPILMMTGNIDVEKENYKLIRKYKIKECLLKPIYPPNLLVKIEKYI